MMKKVESLSTSRQIPSDAQILACLRSTFGYTSFRPFQHEIVRSILGGQDVFVLMPTGGGKSLCYQLPALLLDGLTVVVSPLIALMKDQVDSLQALGIAATYINSSLDSSEIGRRQASVARGDVKLLYVAPERLMMPGFLHLLGTIPVALFAIDEAHCISEWGHDFRPEYRELTRLRALFPSTTLGAFTATATSRVQSDIKTQLGLENAASFRGSFNRSNLFYEVRPKRDAYAQLVAYLRARGPASGIIYCQSRARTESLAAQLRADGFAADAYHAGLENEERRRRQDAFTRDDTQIIVATIAFGMGIDKPDVRFVVHYDLPKNLEGYYQESGRAGRDGEPSDCILFYSPGDAIKHRHFIDEKPSARERQVALRQLRQMDDWAASTTCRRRALLAYFDERFDGQAGPCCDVCRAPASDVDDTVPAQMFLSCVKRTGERFGSAHVIAVLRGSRAERILRLGHDKLSTYGIGRERSVEEWRHLAHELLRLGYIRQDEDEFNAVKLTERGLRVLLKREPVTIAAPRIAASTSDPSATQPHVELFERLRALRKRLADERGVPPYVIFHDTTLREIAAALPRDRRQLLRIPGVGERKMLDYGDAFLSCVADYVGEFGATPATPIAPLPTGAGRPRQREGGLTPTVLTSLRLFEEGRSVDEIAVLRELTPRTIEEHLVAALEAGERVEIGRLVDDEKRQAIEAAIVEVGPERLKPIAERLGSEYSYGEIALVRAALASTSKRLLRLREPTR
jgi:ATP-dependent DNA helicase RecQ